MIRKLIIASLCFFLIGCGSANTTTSSDKVEENVHIHEYGEWEIVRAATCTEKGSRQRDCKCGDIQKDEIDVINHSLTDVEAVEPTCTTKGNTSGQKCDNCEYTTVKELDILEHKLDEGVEISQADCMTAGEKECVCLICGETIKVEIPILEHVFDEGVVSQHPSLNDEGILTYTCTLCGNKKDQVIAKLNLKDYTYNSGNYMVGTDIPGGLYVLYSDTDAGYFKLSSDSNGNKIVSNDNFGRYTYVNLVEGLYLELSNCVAISFLDDFVFSPFDNQYGGGTYLVGKDLAPGKYKLTAAGHGYFCIWERPNGKIKSNGLIDDSESKYITVSKGQYLKLSGVAIEE